MFNDLRIKLKLKDKKLVYKKYGKDVKEECELIVVVELIVCELSLIIKIWWVGEVWGLFEVLW